MPNPIECSPVWRKLLLCEAEAAGLVQAVHNAGAFMSDKEREEIIATLSSFETAIKPQLSKWSDYDPPKY